MTSLWLPASAANFNEQKSFLHMTYFESIFQLFLCKNDEAIKWIPIVFWLSFRLYDCFWVSSLTHEIYLMKTITPANFLECFTYVWDKGIPATASNNCQRIISFLLFCFWDNYICSRFKLSPTHCTGSQSHLWVGERWFWILVFSSHHRAPFHDDTEPTSKTWWFLLENTSFLGMTL